MQWVLDWFSKNKDIAQILSSLIAIFVGFLSVILTALILRTNRRHNQLSVKPLGELHEADYEGRLCVSIRNKGNGPLIIKAIRAEKKGMSKSDLLNWMPNLPEGISWSDFNTNLEGSSLMPSESVPLLEFSLNINNKLETDTRDLIRKSLAEITMEIDYIDIYNNKFSIPPKLLSWFARNLKSEC